MIALITIAVIATLGAIWWWVVHPRGTSEFSSREAQLPLFTSRTPGRSAPAVTPSFSGVVERQRTDAPRGVPARPREADRGATSPDGESGDELAAATVTAVGAANAGLSFEPASAPLAARNGRGARAAVATPPDREGIVATARTVTAREVAPDRGADVDPELARWAPPPPMPVGGTVQFLPGRLEVLQGRTMTGQEVRFVRPERPGERAVVTFGRGEGPPYRHVQLKVPTVSRLHARMALEPGSRTWTLENLSTTNPVEVNGVDLPEGAPPRPLADGDRIEMGEVVFVFRGR